MRDPLAPRQLAGKWCALGTSITWYDANVHVAKGRFTRGYQTVVSEVLTFDGYANCGVNGGTVGQQLNSVVAADWYTIEHGINDWGRLVKPGTLDDYRNNSTNGTFAANYRRLIDKLRTLNPQAKIILCTPRRGYGFRGYLPDSSDAAKQGIHLLEYVKLIRAIAQVEGFAVADFYATCGTDAELPALSIDVALHPNDAGYQRMAQELLRAFAQVD